MATLEELVVDLVANTKDLQGDLKKATKVTEQSTRKMTRSVEDFAEKSSGSMTMFQNAVSTAAGFVGGQLFLGALETAKQGVKDLFNVMVTQGVAAAQVQEDAINSLNTQLALSGDYSRESSADMQAFAKQMQQTSRFGDETTLSMLSLAKTFGRNNEETKRLVQASIELSAATGMSLDSAVKNLGKTYAGLTGELGESVPIIRTLTAEQLKNGEAVDLLINRFSGSALGAIKTFKGGLEQTTNTFGDLQETVGSFITQNQAVLEVIKELNSIILESNDGLDGNKQAYKELVGKGIILFAEALAGTTTAVDAFGRISNLMINTVEQSFVGLGFIATKVLGLFSKSMEEASVAFAAQATELAKKNDEIFSEDTFMSGVAENLFRIRDAAEEGLGAVAKGADAIVEPTNVAKESVEELTKAEEKRLELLKAFATGLSEQASALDAHYNYEVEALKNNLDQKLVTEEEYLEARREMLAEQQALENEQLAQAKANELITEEEHTKAKGALEQKHALAMQKLDVAEQKRREELNKKRAANFSSTMGTISQLANSSSKELAAIGKAAAIYQATIKGYEAVQVALASAPPPFNFALAAAVGAVTAQNVSKIKSTGLQRGIDSVPGTGNRDNFPAVLAPGERVTPSETNKDLTEFLARANSGEGGTGGKIEIEISLKDELIEMIETKLVERSNLGISSVKVVN